MASTENTSTPRAKKIRRVLFPILLLCAVGAGAYWYLHNEQPVDNRLYLFGNVEIRQVNLAFQSTGRIQAIHVTEGNRVEAGQLMAVIDPERYEAAVSQARAETAAQQEIVSRLLAGSRPEEIAKARARVKASEAVLQEAQKNFRRSRILAKTQYVSQQQLDNQQANLESAQAVLEADEQMLQLAIKGPRKEDIAAARATLDARRAALALAEDRLADTRLYAPADGVVRDRILEPGDMAFPRTPVVTLALTSPLWVRAYVSEPDLGKIAPGMRAEVTTDSFPDKTYRGWIGYIAPTAEFTPKQVQTTELRSKLVYQVRVYVCDPQNELRLGMPATVAIDLDASSAHGSTQAADPCREE
jgi:HlyD family secretion protein